MTDRPIIFSAPMVLALLAGRKTMTRRLMARRWSLVSPGDRLWVKERLCQHGHFGFPLGPDGQMREIDNERIWSYFADNVPDATGGRPSIHMPRWASRLTLTVTAKRIEPLQRIRNADILAEGIDPPKSVAFAALWDSLHGAGAWDANPEVVALSFTVHKGNIDSFHQTEVR